MILLALLVIMVGLAVGILVSLYKRKEISSKINEGYIKLPGKGYVKSPSIKPVLSTIPYVKKIFKNPDNWEIYKNIASSANSSCEQIEDKDDLEKCKKAFPFPKIK